MIYRSVTNSVEWRNKGQKFFLITTQIENKKFLEPPSP